MASFGRHGSGLKPGGPPKSRDPRGQRVPSFCSKACRSKTSQAPVFDQQASFSQAHPPLPGLPAGMKAWPISGVLAVCVCVCLRFIRRNKAGGIAARLRRRSGGGGKGRPRGSGQRDRRRGWHCRALAPGPCSTADVALVCCQRYPTVFISTFPPRLDQPMTPR